MHLDHEVLGAQIRCNRGAEIHKLVPLCVSSSSPGTVFSLSLHLHAEHHGHHVGESSRQI